MPTQSLELYAASCNPARRAKQGAYATPAPKSDSQAGADTPAPRNILPTPGTPARAATEEDDDSTSSTPPPPPPSKRGRKPGPLSRSARETQRKLNHSIIEKARRTKINDALATLRQLVPADYPHHKKPADQRDADESDDGDDAWQGKKGKVKKPAGKREEKEKEFKLEILVRTVSFMQELLARVKVLEDQAGSSSPCLTRHGQAGEPSLKRTRSEQDDGDDSSNQQPVKRPSKRANTRDMEARRVNVLPPSPHSIATESRTPQQVVSRLPPISSWLPNSQIDPVLLSPHQRTSPNQVSHLPSPPSSAHFEPTQATQVPPTLNLGPMAMSSLLSPRQQRTTEDESAASFLLQFSASNSPPLPATSSSGLLTVPGGMSFDMSRMRTSCVTPVHPTLRPSQAQTPSSMLGLRTRV